MLVNGWHQSTSGAGLAGRLPYKWTCNRKHGRELRNFNAPDSLSPSTGQGQQLWLEGDAANALVIALSLRLVP